MSLPPTSWFDETVPARLHASARRHAGRIALTTDGDTLTYAELFARARSLAETLASLRVAPVSGHPSGAVMGSRSARCFTGLLATVLSGAAYVPLNPKFPSARNAHMLRASGATTLAIEERDLEPLAAELAAWEIPLVLLVLDAVDARAWAARLPRHRVIACSEGPPTAGDDALSVGGSGSSPLYVMFTSGSTGTPKGVVVTQRNVLSCLSYLGERYGITPSDRLSQNFELTFDLSVFDVFLTWLYGASFHVPPADQQAAPARFIESAALSVWFSVPSMALFMDRLRMLNPGAFPRLRWSLFCGERLPLRIAQAWAAAAPSSTVENLYGPTEATIACTTHRLDARSAERAVQGSVPIGLPFEGTRAVVVNDAGQPIAPGEPGELWVGGSQVAMGYLGDLTKTNERFVHPSWDASASTWYRTGDLARLVEDELVHLGRIDDQVKIRGYRVELGEVESALRLALANDSVAVVAIPATDIRPAKLVAFVVGGVPDEVAVRAALSARLPDYMHPAELVEISSLPLNSNGKTDKTTLMQRYGG